MKNETERLEKFKKAIFDEVDAKAREIISEAETERDEKLEKARREADGFVQSKISQIDKDCEAKSVRELSSDSLQAKRNVLLSREGLIDKVFSNVRDKLEEFMKTPEYGKMLSERVKSCAEKYPDDKGVVYVALKDEGLADLLSLNGKYKVEPSETVEVGGAMVVLEEKGIALDCTFDTALSEQRESFARRAGLNL